MRMATSDTPRALSDDHGTRTGWSKYDLIMGLLPLPIVAGVVGAAMLSLPSAVGLGVGAPASMAILGYALFVATPTGQ